jgi:hypothetical protein
MAYGSNILKKEAAYYSLVNATIINGILHIGAGGSATQTLSVSDLPAVTKNMLFTCISDDEYSNHYVPDIQVIVYTKMNSDVTYSKAILYPVQVAPNKYSCEFTMEEGSYDEMYVTLTAQKSVNLILWELCAEASDETATVEIEGVKQALAKLLFDYNTSVFSGDMKETTVAFITCRLLQNTDVQGHFEFTFANSHACCMTLRFYDNGIEELFSPLYYDLKPGKNSIGVPHSYLNRLAGNHNFFITAQVSSGTFTVPIRGSLFTIDAGYLAKRELEVAMDLQDIALKQLIADNGPNEIWGVGIEEGIAYVRSRSYSEENVNVGWTAIGSLGEATEAALEFDGDWVLRPQAEQYTIITEDVPWYFWLKNGILYACRDLPSEDNVPIILSRTVAGSIHAVKGYSNIDILTQDQGLIVCYIDYDGCAYYCNYSYDSIAQRKKWSVPIKLPVNMYKYNHITVHRLNDYRVSFVLSGVDNLWIFSDRTYVGQSIYPENYNMLNLYEDADNYVPYFNYLPADYVPPTDVIIYDQTQDIQEETVVYTTTTYYWYHYLYANNMTLEMLCTNPPEIGKACTPDPQTGARRTIIGDLYKQDDQYFIPVEIFNELNYHKAIQQYNQDMVTYEEEMTAYNQGLIEEEPIKPVEPQKSAFTSVADIPVKQFGLDSTEQRTDIFYRYKFKLNYPIFGSEALYPFIDRIKASGFNDRYVISDVLWAYTDTYTEITVLCVDGDESKEASTIITFTVDIDPLKTLRIRDTQAPHYVTVLQNGFTVVFDITNYHTLISSEEYVLSVNNITTAYNGLNKIQNSATESYTVDSTESVTYDIVEDQYTDTTEQYSIIPVISNAYYKSGEEPI